MVGLNKRILFSLVGSSFKKDGSNSTVIVLIKVQLTFQDVAVFFETTMEYVRVILPVKLALVMPSTLRF
jgi:hypothetical protein